MVRKSTQSEGNKFGCVNCGEPYTVYPPDSSLKFPYLSPCTETSDLEPNHNLKTFRECMNCHYKNELYWCQGHTYVVSSSDTERDEDYYMPSSFRNRTFD